MTPLHPFAAAAAGAMMGLAALTAPNTPAPRVVEPCATACAARVASVLPVVGETATVSRLHRIKHPGRYGLSHPPEGQVYAIVEGHLVRIEIGSGLIRSVLRPATRILD